MVVAVKVMTPPPQSEDDCTLTPSPVLDLRREAAAAMRLSHPFITRVFTWEKYGNWDALIMEYIAGPTLQGLLAATEARRLPADLAAGFAIDALDALSFAHAQGVIHNDVKPRNLLVAPGDQIKLCDFGIASGRHHSSTLSTGFVGTLAFISPERLQNAPPDARSDVYALAATVYHLVHGTPPFGTGGSAAIEGHLREPPRPSPHIPQALWKVLVRGLEKEPSERFQTAQAMRVALLEAGFVSRFHEVHHHPLLERSVAQERLATGPEAPAFGPPRAIEAPVVTLEPVHEPAKPPVAPSTPSSPPPRPRPKGMALISAREFTHMKCVLSTPGFLLDITPVTNHDYAEFVRATREPAPAWWSGEKAPADREDHPVVGVTLAAARRFAAWAGKRLPTAAEWVLAARGPAGQPFPWGTHCDRGSCHCPMEGHKVTASVRAHPASASSDGVLDLFGNVWEWTENAADLGATSPDRNLVFGASFKHQCNAESGQIPQSEVGSRAEYPYLGFRCAADVEAT